VKEVEEAPEDEKPAAAEEGHAREADADDKFSLALMIGKIEGLENPNPPPPPRTDGEEEEGEQAAVSPEYVFYQEHPPSYFVEIPCHSSQPLRTQEILWGEEDEGEGGMNFEFSQRIDLTSSFDILMWLRFEGVVLDLYIKKQVYVPPTPREEGEEAQEAAEEEGEASPPEFVVTRIATSRVETEDLVNKTSILKVTAKMTMTDESFDTIRPIDDKDTERAIANMKKSEKKEHKEKKRRDEDKDQAHASARQGGKDARGGDKRHNHVHIECQLELNPPPAPPQEPEE